MAWLDCIFDRILFKPGERISGRHYQGKWERKWRICEGKKKKDFTLKKEELQYERPTWVTRECWRQTSVRSGALEILSVGNCSGIWLRSKQQWPCVGWYHVLCSSLAKDWLIGSDTELGSVHPGTAPESGRYTWFHLVCSVCAWLFKALFLSHRTLSLTLEFWYLLIPSHSKATLLLPIIVNSFSIFI